MVVNATEWRPSDEWRQSLALACQVRGSRARLAAAHVHSLLAAFNVRNDRMWAKISCQTFCLLVSVVSSLTFVECDIPTASQLDNWIAQHATPTRASESSPQLLLARQ